MQQGTNRRFQEKKARQPELIGREDMIKAPPTEPEAFLLWGAQRLSIAEVLSPSSTGKDFTEKLEEYAMIEALQTYLISSQEGPRAWVLARRSDASWPRIPVELVRREDVIALGGLAVEPATAAVFRGIPDASTVE
jgi:hypothetical protein